MTRNYNELAEKLQFDQSLAANWLTDLQKETTTLKYWLSMGEQKVQIICSRHKAKMRPMITDLLESG